MQETQEMRVQSLGGEDPLEKKMATPLQSLVAQLVKNLPAMQETLIQFLGWEDPLEEGMATHSSILSWRIPWTGKPGGPRYMGVTKSQIRLSN